ncbi:S-adenosyl-L-methionine-dependent methyltransferase [Aspergillus homomorphus CBS 101889]|uniref:S-adenosyl-L-methionine-dependent methyltransferase n=1 Tax=Aspergillus homomorphus (strain CBS 101889) TaxID=1450537 RepID=A0A395HYZ7_ASPHC|nr:S-adenosyl-L-methionine-dependent methyltransferase [Aspergillus homomorphus CBS 101889]RAL13162.1 S-adenosyl-L-methionine-dependent methyltransferase [Aspergillus homomorphus CBS 101889]
MALNSANYLDAWSSLWDTGDDLPWDRGFPNPALADALIQHQATIGKAMIPNEHGQPYRRKALVPGCGRGVDVLLLASFGFDAYGLECSASAIEACKREAATHQDSYPVRDATIGKGTVTFVQGDFFDDSWLQEIGVPRNGFDVIYDYAFYCALNPSMRPQWALRHTQLLAPSPAGNLICLEFPRSKDPKAPGPPFSSASETYLAHLGHPGEEVAYDDRGVVEQDFLQRAPSSAALERVVHWQPERTHKHGYNAAGEVEDRVSIWRRRA